MRFFIILLIALVCSSASRATASPESRLKTFIKVSREAAAKLPPASVPMEPGARPRLSQATILSFLDRLERLPAPVTLESAQGPVSQITEMLPASDKVRRAGNALIACLVADRDRRVAHYRAEVDAVLAQAIQACLAATTPADLDASLKTLAPYQRLDDAARLRGFDSGAQQRAVQMLQFVTRWQDYLGARQSGDNDRIRQVLYELKNLADPTLIPRSKIFALPVNSDAGPGPTTPVASALEALPSILARMEKATGFDDLAPLVKDLRPILAANPGNQSLREIWNLMTGYLGDRTALESGQVNPDLFFRNERTAALRANPYFTDAMDAMFRRLSARLQCETLLTVFKDSGITLAAGESADTYIFRVAQTAATAENWEYALRTLEFYRALFPDKLAPAWLSREISSCTTYVAARRLDESDQIPQAILAYQEALRATGRLTPLTLISNRLAEFKTRYPEAFDAATAIPRVVLIPSRPNFPDRFNRPSPETPNTYLVPRAERPFTP